MQLDTWAQRHGISTAALTELRGIFGISTEPVSAQPVYLSEAAVQASIRMEASCKGSRLWRNNVGAAHTAEGSFIRFGLCNESKAMNTAIKSSDLVGIRPVVITEAHVGRTIGQFLAREVKHGGWKYTGTKREQAQLAFLNLVASLGGDAAFSKGRGTI